MGALAGGGVMTPLTRRKRELVAYHEASHAVVAYRLGYKPTFVTIRAFQGAQGRVELRRIYTYRHKPPTRRQIRADMAIALAGPIGEAIRICQMPPRVRQDLEKDFVAGCAGDFCDVDDALLLLSADPDETQAFRTTVDEQVRALVRADWSSIVFIARALMQCRRLNRRAMIDLMGIADAQRLAA